MAGTTDVHSYPTHTRMSHPGWYSRLTYLHTYPETFATWDGANYYNMMYDRFSDSVNKKGNMEWPANYWKPGMQQRIKGLFLVNSVADDVFDMTFGIEDKHGDSIKVQQNNTQDNHTFKSSWSSVPVQFEWNIYLNHVDAGTPYFSIHGFYHYEDFGFFGDDSYNQGYHHIPFYGSGANIDLTIGTYPYMSIETSAKGSIQLRNLTIEELGS